MKVRAKITKARMEKLVAGDALIFRFVAKASDPEIELEIKLEPDLKDKFEQIFDKIWDKTLDKVDKIASAILK